MKEYLKMSDVFVGEYKPAIRIDCNPSHRYGEQSVELHGVPAHYAAHAINSHDELVEMNRELLSELEALSKAYVNLLSVGKDRIEELGGQCDEVLYMAAHDSALVRACSITGKYSGGKA
ncbi:MAG: hypothetical protein ACRDD7_15960 [Peptostreptococcaceae bacterium]